VFTLRTLPAEPNAPRPEVAESSGFSLHAGIAAKASQRDKVERLARYVSRPPVGTESLSLTPGRQRAMSWAQRLKRVLAGAVIRRQKKKAPPCGGA
jgi:transposase